MPTRVFNSGSRIIYNGSAPQFMGSAHPNDVAGVTTEIDNVSGVTLAADVTLGGNLILTNGNLSVSNRTLTLNGGFTPNSNFLNVLSTSSISIGGTGAFGTLRTTGSTTINNFTLNRPASGSITLGTDLTIAGTLTQTVGDIILNGRTLTISGPYSRTDGSFAIDASSNFIVNGSGSLPSGIQFITPQALNSLTLDRASATLATSSSFTVTNLNLRSGTFNNTGTITIATGGVITRTEGSLISNTPTAQTSYDLVYDISTNISSGAEVPNLTTELRHVTKLGGATLTLTEPFIINGDLTLSNGIFDAGSNAIDLKGNLLANSTSILTSSPFTFSGTTSISGSALIQFGEVTITGTVTPTVNIRIDGDLINDGTLNAGTGAQTVTFGGNTTISGGSAHNFNNVTITGTLVAPSVMSVAGNFALSGGTFTNSTGTVVFNGTSSITGSPQFSNITVNTGATLNGPSNLTMAGNFIVNGTFNSGTGRVTFNGTSNQDVNRTAGTAGTVNLFNVTVNKSSGTLNFRSTIANTIFRIQNEFTLAQAGTSSPDVDFDGPGGTGNVVLASTATRTAKVTSVPAGAQIVGNLTTERFVQNDDGLRAWRYLASPLVGATVADWQGEIQITGQFSNPSTGGTITNPNAPSMYRWTETNGGDANSRYEAWPNNISLAASSFALTNGRGYATYIRDVGNPVLTTRGTLRFGDVGIGLTITGSEPDAAGFNLVGNPYPAPVDWDLVSLPGGVSTIISMLDNVGNGGLGSGQFVYYTQGGIQVGNFSGIIGSGQAFWVETSTNTTLTFSESHKASDINPVILRERQLANVLRINVEGNGRKDETVVYFRDEASDEYDMSYDARKRENEYLNLFTFQQREAGIEKFAINALKDINCSREVSIGLEKFNQGTYSFYFTEIESFDKPYIFTLVDNFTGVSTSLEEGAYTFQVTENPLSNGNERFKIVISEVGINNALAVQGDEKCDVTAALVTINQTEPTVSYQAYFDGVALGEAVLGNGSSISLSLTGGTFEPGVYEIPVKAFNSCSELFLDQKASLVIIDVLDAEITSEGNTLYSNYTSGNQWYLDGSPIEGATGQEYEASASGLYKLVVTTTEGCTTEADRQFVITSNETGIDQGIRVYPNPVQSIVKVEVRSVGPVEVKLMTTLGVELTSKALTDSGFEKYTEFDLSDQSNGMYILHVQKGGRVHQVKIIKTNK
ncbi:MAG: T9SS type A sorting domain-containing protein [Cyclobacteriaceae bacterium]|nr:T9SS type A sorting domain-containing protein [Cyclobacteriaceae bacterium]